MELRGSIICVTWEKRAAGNALIMIDDNLRGEKDERHGRTAKEL